MPPRDRDDHLFGPGPKRILSLDGGGVRGIVSLAFLERIEALLRARAGGDPDLRLSDHFDLIGGTSTGAIVATGLALGLRASDLAKMYLDLSHRAFQGPPWHFGIIAPKFTSAGLLNEVKRQVGDETLGSARLKTGLAVVAKRIDSASPWVFHNNPRSRYYRPPADDPTATANRDLPLYEILRASTAAPTYYEPEFVTVAEGVEGLFVDGGVSPYSNPALLLFMMATTRAYGYGWPTGLDKLSLISIGTGMTRPTDSAKDFAEMFSAHLAVKAMTSILTDCVWQAQAILQWLSQSPRPWVIDSEAGDLSDEMPLAAPLLGYQRYDLMLEEAWLAQELGERLTKEQLETLHAFDRPELVDRFYDLGRRAAERQIDPAHIDQLI